jgi:hypothetical protein
MSMNKFRYQVIAIQKTDGEFTESSCYTVICFGLVDRSLWVNSLPVKKNKTFCSIVESVCFPTGSSWCQSNSAFCAFAGSSGSFETKQIGSNPAYRVEYALKLVSDKIVSQDGFVDCIVSLELNIDDRMSANLVCCLFKYIYGVREPSIVKELSTRRVRAHF